MKSNISKNTNNGTRLNSRLKMYLKVVLFADKKKLGFKRSIS